MIDIQISDWYGIGVAGIFVLPLLLIISSHLLFTSHRFLCRLAYPFLKWWVIENRLPIRIRGRRSTTWLRVITLVVVVAGNVVSLALDARSQLKTGRLAGRMSLVNLIALSLGARPGILFLRTSIYSRLITIMHSCLSCMFCLQIIVHVAASAPQVGSFASLTTISGLTAAALVVALMVLSLGNIRRRMYELFAISHSILPVLLFVTAWLHISNRSVVEPPLLFMLLAVLVRSLVLLSHVAFMTYNNVNGQGTTRSRISNVLHESHQHGTRLHPRSVRVHIKSVRPVKIEPGQYVYLRFLGLGWLAVVQSHPFYIAWQEKDEKGCSVLVIIIERQRGLTRAMYAQESTHPAMYPQALVLDGPYGVHLDLTKYRTVLLFATGIGIAGQLPYFEHLLRCHHDRKTRSKKISLFWEIDSELDAAAGPISEMPHPHRPWFGLATPSPTFEFTSALCVPITAPGSHSNIDDRSVSVTTRIVPSEDRLRWGERHRER